MTEEWVKTDHPNGRKEYHDANGTLRQAIGVTSDGRLDFHFQHDEQGRFHGKQISTVLDQHKNLAYRTIYAWHDKPVSALMFEFLQQVDLLATPVLKVLKTICPAKCDQNRPG